MQIEQFLMLDIQKKAIRQIYEEAFVYAEVEIQDEPDLPAKPRHSWPALLYWWLGSRLVKTGRRFLQYAG